MKGVEWTQCVRDRDKEREREREMQRVSNTGRERDESDEEKGGSWGRERRIDMGKRENTRSDLLLPSFSLSHRVHVCVHAGHCPKRERGAPLLP